MELYWSVVHVTTCIGQIICTYTDDQESIVNWEGERNISGKPNKIHVSLLKMAKLIASVLKPTGMKHGHIKSFCTWFWDTIGNLTKAISTWNIITVTL